MLKDLGLVVDVRTKEAGSYALSLAKLINAHLTMVPVDVEPAIAAYANQELRYDVILATRAGRREVIADTLEQLQLDGLEQGLSISHFSLDDFADDAIEEVSESLRLFDLIIVEQINKERNPARSRIVAASLFKTGRPVLIVPYIQAQPATFKTVLIAWDGSVPAVRAVGDALPLLATAHDVVIVQVDAKTPKRCDGTMLQQHLSRHAIDARIKRTASAEEILRIPSCHMRLIRMPISWSWARMVTPGREKRYLGARRALSWNP